MNNELTYHSSKVAFNQGQFQRSASLCEKILESDVSTETKIIMKANYFMSNLLYTQAELNDDEAQNILSLLLGIQNEKHRVKSYNSFLTNICLYEVSKKKYENALKIIEKLIPNEQNESVNELIGSISLTQNVKPAYVTPFLSIWDKYLMKDSESILKCAGEFYGARYIPFLMGYAYFQNRNYSKAQESFVESVSSKFRITESYNYLGICSFYLNRMKDSVNYFEKSIRNRTMLISYSVFNLSEVCGVLEHKAEQIELLHFYQRLEQVHQEGSISTLYLLARATLESGDYESSVKQYESIFHKIRYEGIDPPSPYFMSEYAFALNMTGSIEESLNVLPPENAIIEFDRLVAAQTMFLSGRFEECEKILFRLNDGSDVQCNKGILSFLSGDDLLSMRQINSARKTSPNDTRITRNAVLILFARPQTVKSGCAMWLSSLGYQRDHQPDFYEDLINKMKSSNSDDNLTICVLENWKYFQRKKP